MKILTWSKEIFTLCKDLFIQSIWKLKIINDSPLALSAMLKIFVYLFSVFFVANFLYVVFVKRKIVKGGKENFRIFPTVIILPLIVIIIFEIFNIIFVSDSKLKVDEEIKLEVLEVEENSDISTDSKCIDKEGL